MAARVARRAAPRGSAPLPQLVCRLQQARGMGSADERIASAAPMVPIADVLADRLAMRDPEAFSLFGRYKAKIKPALVPDAARPARLVVVTAMTPTKSGEGKTCTSVGLNDGLNLLGHRSIVALREPSLGPVFGSKGGAAGGGYAQLNPMADINLHFTGDQHAVTSAHNLLAAMMDNHIHWGAEPRLDVRRIELKRVLDISDRALRNIVVGLGGQPDGTPRQDGFDITVASEVMAILCLAKDLPDLRARLAKIVVGYTRGGKEAVTAKDLGAEGAMTALLKDAFEPNVVQSLERNVGMVHGCCFANIAQGTSSFIATRTAMQLADFVVTEGGFGADLGFEKFCNIKCRKGGLEPSAAVIVATVRALKLHGGVGDKALATENVPAVTKGFPNLKRHIENVAKFGLPAVVSINRFATDSPAELAEVQRLCAAAGAKAVVAEQWQHGGKGARELAQAVVAAADSYKPGSFKLLYEDALPLKQKVERIASEIYRAGRVEWDKDAEAKLAKFTEMGFGHVPVCIAKTQYSFSDDPALINAPTGHTIHVRDARLAAGAEFVVVLLGSIMTMPGLPKRPAALDINVDDKTGNITGLF
jgi:formate--tetrahydrofolate ligase